MQEETRYHRSFKPRGLDDYRFICLVCGRAYQEYPLLERCSTLVRMVRLEDIAEWSEPFDRVRRFTVYLLGTGKQEVTINGNHTDETAGRGSSPGAAGSAPEGG